MASFTERYHTLTKYNPGTIDKTTIEAYYDPAKNDWDESIDRVLREKGLKHGDVTVICMPESMKKIETQGSYNQKRRVQNESIAEFSGHTLGTVDNSLT